MAPEFDYERPSQPKDWNQLGVLVLDGSDSMTLKVKELEDWGVADQTKASAVNMAVRDLLTRLKASRKARNFTIAVVKFHEHVTEETEPTPVVDPITGDPTGGIDDSGNYDPTSAGTGGTFIGAGLARAKEICEKFFADHQHEGLPTDAVILLMTDGECGQPERTKEIAQELKQNRHITLAASFFATKDEEQHGVGLLRAISSDPERYFKIVYDPKTLRTFWRDSFPT